MKELGDYEQTPRTRRARDIDPCAAQMQVVSVLTFRLADVATW